MVDAIKLLESFAAAPDKAKHQSAKVALAVLRRLFPVINESNDDDLVSMFIHGGHLPVAKAVPIDAPLTADQEEEEEEGEGAGELAEATESHWKNSLNGCGNGRWRSQRRRRQRGRIG